MASGHCSTDSLLSFSPLGPLQIHYIPPQLLYTPRGGYGKFWLILHVLEGTDTGDSRGHPRLALSSAVLTPFRLYCEKAPWGRGRGDNLPELP